MGGRLSSLYDISAIVYVSLLQPSVVLLKANRQFGRLQISFADFLRRVRFRSWETYPNGDRFPANTIVQFFVAGSRIHGDE